MYPRVEPVYSPGAGNLKEKSRLFLRPIEMSWKDLRALNQTTPYSTFRK